MDRQEQSPYTQDTIPVTHFSSAPQSERPRAGRSFSYLALLLGMLLGLLFGCLGTLFYISSVHDVSVPPVQSAPDEAAISVQLSSTYISRIVTKEASRAKIPGSLKNIRVTTAHNAPITVSGDDQMSFIGLAITNHMTVQLQPVIRTCQPQVHITHADISGIPVTSFVSSFEAQINQQFSKSSKNSLLPRGFVYCATNIHTEPSGLFVAYSAKPI
jgi:hypothetical protein